MSARPEPSKVTVACDSLAAVTVIVVTLRLREHSHIEGVFEEEGAFKCRPRAYSRHALERGRRLKPKRWSNSSPAVVGSNGLRGILIRRDVFCAAASALMRAAGDYSSISRDLRPLSLAGAHAVPCLYGHETRPRGRREGRHRRAFPFLAAIIFSRQTGSAQRALLAAPIFPRTSGLASEALMLAVILLRAAG
jgi:hypothetical protein